MKLYIAEKKEVAGAISEAFHGRLQDGIFELENGDAVTWLSGHLMRLTEPDEANPRYAKWNLSDLPMTWEVGMQPQKQQAVRLKQVVNEIKCADELVNAGDPDPEGQRLVDEVIEYSGVKKPVYRILINDNNPSAIIKAAKKMEPNEKYHGLSMSALARAVGDQRYGFNLTRAYTLLAQRAGLTGTLSVGRVQTPILGLVVRRDLQIEQHKASDYYVLDAVLSDFSAVPQPISTHYVIEENDAVDDKGRLIDKAAIQQICDAVQNAAATVAKIETQRVEIAPPLPYNLLALQADAAGKYNLRPKRVLEITQNLRDKHRAITYNRSDCRYLNDERHEEAPALLQALSGQYPIAAAANSAIRSKAFNSAKVTAHHAIIPTESVPALGSLSKEEQQIYDLIVQQYIVQFYPPRVLDKAKVTFDVKKYQFIATSSDEVSAGWHALFCDSEDEENSNSQLGLLQKEDKGKVSQASVSAKKTQPPKRYTMSTLLKDLASAAKYVKDPHIKALLLEKDADKADEKGGIGTPATRDGHIETLFNRGYISEQKKQIISTPLGRQLIAELPEFATTPDMTALWHEKQKQIEAGTLELQSLLDDIDRSIADEIARVSRDGLNIKTDAPICPACGKGHLRRIKGKKGFFWGCSAFRDGCTYTAPDDHGKPGKPTVHAEISTEHLCPKCKTGYLQRHPTKKDPKKFWWGCSGWKDGCDYKASDNKGKPGKAFS